MCKEAIGNNHSPVAGRRLDQVCHVIGDDHHIATSSARVVLWETNTKRHDYTRVLLEATDINDLQGALQQGNGKGSLRVDSRVESFCMEMSGHDDGLDSKKNYLGDQGMLFFLPVREGLGLMLRIALTLDSNLPRT